MRVRRQQLSTNFRGLASPRMVLFLLIGCGMALRIIWSFMREGPGAAGEAFNVAAAIGNGRGFADAYWLGQGPTAHVTPVTPLIAGAVYRIFGVNAPAAELVLACWALGLLVGTWLLLFKSFERLGTPLAARLGALAFLSFAPVYFGQESADFRIWEGGLTAFLSTLFLERLLAAREIKRITPAYLGCMGALAALLFFVNPPFGIAAFVCGFVFSLKHLRLGQTALVLIVSVVTLIVLIGPWTLRNDKLLGAPVLLRSNAGMELALANNQAAVESRDQLATYQMRLAEIHPAVSRKAQERMRAVGEVAYSNSLGSEARQWMYAHPASVVRLSLRHIRQFYAPEPWMFRVYGSGMFPRLRAALSSAAAILGLLAVALACTRRRPGWAYPALIATVPVLLLAFFQPIPRYTYLLYPLLAFCSADLLSRFWLRAPKSLMGDGVDQRRAPLGVPLTGTFDGSPHQAEQKDNNG